jgi:hypothetical protein
MVPSTQNLQFDIAPKTTVNRALAQNDAALFHAFVIKKSGSGIVRSLKVDVELHTGAEPIAFRKTFDVRHATTDLTTEVKLPLSWAAGAVAGQRLQTSLVVKVRWGTVELYRQTHSLTILSDAEWVDDDDSRHFLPSFVRPFDAAVQGVLTRAEPLLACLADDHSAGFDGYQQGDAGWVDLQVRAIWTALSHQMGIRYVNPPPTYTRGSQRLRAPSAVVGERRGTCIDLALLLASCLEYVEIHPIVVLLHDHAFPAYWRSAEPIETFAESVPARREDSPRWVARGRGSHALVREFVDAGMLVPLESVAVTRQGGLAQASAEGLDNLRVKRRFLCAVDVATARAAGVTPLGG